MVEEDRNSKHLLQKIAIGDIDAFRKFYNLYYLQVYRFASYFVKSSLLIQEVVSDIFCAIWQNRKKIAEIENFEGYLYTITKNKALYYLNKENKFSTTEINYIPYDTLPDKETPESLTIDKEFTAALINAINELPERCRLIFLMAREEGLKYKEIAQILSISEKTVNAQMVIAIKKLTKQLGDIILLIF